MRVAWNIAGIGLLCFTLIGLLFTAQFYLYGQSLGRPVSWGQTLLWMMGSWYLWALLCPGIWWTSRRIRPTRAGWGGAAAAQAGVGVLTASVHVVLYALWTSAVAPMGVGPPGWLGAASYLFATGFSWDLLCYAAITATCYAMDNARRIREGQLRASRLETELARAQLDALRMQLHPHFLFNTLNAIAALIREDPRGAEEMVTRLSDLLRAALQKSAVPRVSLREELEFVEKYLEIQRVRFGARLDAAIEAASKALDVAVPTFILQPVIENAVRHGLNSEGESCRVRVSASVAGSALSIKIHDSGPGLAGDASGEAREGVGLSNTRARLRQTYGERARLELRNRRPRGCVVVMEIPIDAGAADMPGCAGA